MPATFRLITTFRVITTFRLNYADCKKQTSLSYITCCAEYQVYEISFLEIPGMRTMVFTAVIVCRKPQTL